MTIQEKAVAGAGAVMQNPPTQREIERAGWTKTAKAYVYMGLRASVTLEGPHAQDISGCSKYVVADTMAQAIERALDFCDSKKIRITEWTGNLTKENDN